MTNISSTKQLTAEEIVQKIEVLSAIALHKSMTDGDPKHHQKMIKESVALIDQYAANAELEAVIKFGNGSWYREPEYAERYYKETIAEYLAQQKELSL